MIVPNDMPTRIVFALFLLSPASMSTKGDQLDSMSPAEAISYICHSRHGLAMLPHGGERIIADMKVRPERYRKALARCIRNRASTVAHADWGTSQHLIAYLALASHVGGDEVRDEVRRLFSRLQELAVERYEEAGNDGPSPKPYVRVVVLRGEALAVLAHFGDACAVDVIVAELNRPPKGGYFRNGLSANVEYLEAVADQRPDMLPRLREVVTNRRSAAYDDKALRRLIAKLEARPECNASSNGTAQSSPKPTATPQVRDAPPQPPRERTIETVPLPAGLTDVDSTCELLAPDKYTLLASLPIEAAGSGCDVVYRNPTLGVSVSRVLVDGQEIPRQPAPRHYSTFDMGAMSVPSDVHVYALRIGPALGVREEAGVCELLCCENVTEMDWDFVRYLIPRDAGTVVIQY